jgi:CelD/BcsL family acetyltransferase involved in cellulose biosynthesis
MNIRNITVDRLTSDEIAAWSAIQRATPRLSSPYFRPEFTQAVAAVRRDVEVAVVEEDGQPIGFLPFQRTPWNAGRPIAGRLSDFHALVARPGTECDPISLVRACRLASWHFDHLVDLHESFERFAWSSAESPYIDLSTGFEAYRAENKRSRGIMQDYGQKSRKIEREIGPLRYEQHVPEQAILETLIQWKSRQYERTKVDNCFAFPWVINLLHRLFELKSEHLSAVLSVTYVADRIAAINFGMRSGDVLHPWFPAYSVELGQYSPGTLHWVATMRDAESMGIRRIDLVSGSESYKQRLMNGAIRVVQGVVDPRPSLAVARRAWRQTREFVRASPVYTRVRAPVRMLHNVKSWLELR